MARHKLLGYVRLSKKTKASNSPARQRRAISLYAAQHDHEIIEWVEDDESVSGGMPPETRPGLGPWLRGEGPKEFDGIIVDQPDRLGRSTLDFLSLQERFYRSTPHKVLISVAPEFDFTSPEGRKAARDYMSSAEFEREKDSQRTTRSIADLRDFGWYWGGPVPYGLRTIKVAVDEDNEHWEFRPNPATAKYVREMADKYLAGDTLRGVARWMNHRGILSPQGKQWGLETVRIVLRSPAIAGMMVGKEGEPHRNEYGETVRICEPIISYDERERILARMKSLSHGGPKSESSYLYGVLYCGRDGSSFVSASQTTRGKLYRYMKCRNSIKKDAGQGRCALGVIEAESVEAFIDETIMRELGNVQMREKVTEQAITYSDELQRLADDIDALERQYMTGNLSAERFASMSTRFETRQQELKARVRPERTYWRELDTTFGEHWQSLDWPSRQAFLVRNGVMATVIPEVTVVSVDTGKQSKLAVDSPITTSPGSLSRQVGRYRIVLWLGDLDELRKKAADS